MSFAVGCFLGLFCWYCLFGIVSMWQYVVLMCKLHFILIALKQSRAQSAMELLQELNSDVSGNFVEEVCLPKLVLCVYYTV